MSASRHWFGKMLRPVRNGGRTECRSVTGFGHSDREKPAASRRSVNLCVLRASAVNSGPALSNALEISHAARTAFGTVALLAALAFAPALPGQVVNVTMSLEKNRIAAGATTTLRVYGQIVPEQQATTDRIFSWYVDWLNSNGAIARGEYASLVKPASDNDPQTSSSGVTQDANRRTIYDTFRNLPDAGRLSPVLLFEVPVTGLAPGVATFRVQAGSGAPLSHDFIVAPAGGGDPLTGGNYALASVELEVIAQPRVSLAHTRLPGGDQQTSISFPIDAGYDHYVEYRDGFESGSWQPVAGGPHNSGSVTDTTSVPRRFYRLRMNRP